jgi:DNA-binding transcriptional MerR regulator
MTGRAPHYPIRAAARLAGLSVDTLRAWERRYGAVVPRRGDRGRVYTDADVSRLIRLARLVGRGHAIGTIAGIDDAGLDGLLGAEAAHRPGPPAAASIDLAPLTAAVARYDLDALETALGRYAAVLPPADLVFDIVVPFLHEIGRRRACAASWAA